MSEKGEDGGWWRVVGVGGGVGEKTYVQMPHNVLPTQRL